VGSAFSDIIEYLRLWPVFGEDALAILILLDLPDGLTGVSVASEGILHTELKTTDASEHRADTDHVTTSGDRPPPPARSPPA
jgi:hypothetical protein